MSNNITTNENKFNTSGEGVQLEVYANQEWKEVEIGESSSKIPRGWSAPALGEIASFRKGKGLSKKVLLEEGNHECIHYGELFTKYGPEAQEIVSKTNVEKDGMVLSRAGDVLMPTSDVTPNGLATATSLTSNGVVLGGDILVIRPQPGSVHSPFLSRVIRSDRAQIMGLVSGSTVYHIYAKDMAGFLLKLPTLEEQLLIAQALSTQEAQVADLRKLASHERKRLEWLSDELLSGRLRVVEDPDVEPVVVSRDESGRAVEVLPGVRLVENEGFQLTTINGKEVCKPADWMVLSLGDLADVVTGNTPSKRDTDFWEGGNVNWFSTPDFKKKKNGSVHNSAIKLTEAGAKKSRVCPVGTVMVSCIATVGEVAVLGVEGSFNQQINGILPNNRFVSDYLRHYLEHIAWKIKSLASESVIKIINKTNFEGVEVVLPTIKEQSLIASVLSAQETQAAEIERLADLEQKRLDWLSDELLSGRLRLRVKEAS